MAKSTADLPVGRDSRRAFLSRASALVGAGALCGCSGRAPGAQAAAPAAPTPAPPERVALTREARDRLTPAEVLSRAQQGNRRYLQGASLRRDLLAEQRSTSAGQFPAAVVLGCIDSRGPAEIIFDLGIGDIFNCRVAGNVANPDVLGSLEFATQLSGAKLLVVIGHSACGAVKGAISGSELGNLTQLLARIRPAVDATVYEGERTAANLEFVDAVARKNVELTIATIRRESPVIAELESAGRLMIAAAFHDLSTGAVDFAA
ncbi:MAG: carbonic anhydrase family protein [Steroidobacteraceae bacterium]|jgi:carbonic anhydrase|nr:carbonic anhydrase family protein [Steroidobacteraceae bacterium]